jgi:hypothetical protein
MGVLRGWSTCAGARIAIDLPHRLRRHRLPEVQLRTPSLHPARLVGSLQVSTTGVVMRSQGHGASGMVVSREVVEFGFAVFGVAVMTETAMLPYSRFSTYSRLARPVNASGSRPRRCTKP